MGRRGWTRSGSEELTAASGDMSVAVAKVLAETVFEPLGMKHTKWAVRREELPKLAACRLVARTMPCRPMPVCLLRGLALRLCSQGDMEKEPWLQKVVHGESRWVGLNSDILSADLQHQRLPHGFNVPSGCAA